MSSNIREEVRVAWFADIFDEMSGVITDTIEVYNQAIKRNIPWYPITCYKSEIEPFKVFKPVMSIPTGSVYKDSSMYMPNFLSVVSYLKEKKVNLIVSNTPAIIGFVAMGVSSFLKIPWVDIYHTDVDFYMNKLTKGILKPFMNLTALSFMHMYHKKADLIFVRNQDYYNLILKKGHPAKKIKYYPAGVDQNRFHPKFYDRSIWGQFNIDPKKKILLFVGRITKVKDIIFLLDYASDFTDNKKSKLNDFIAVLVGEGPEYNEYKEKYSSHSNIYFLGIRKGEILQKIFASADLSVLPSASETLGKTILEGMASGVPALVSDKGGPKDYIQDSVNGKIFKAGDYADFCRVLSEILNEKYDLKKMGDKALESVKEYTMHNLFDKFLVSIKTLVKVT